MASPDVNNYVDLTVYDMQPIDIYNAAVEYARTALPEWTPVTGSIEDAILQAASTMTGYLLGAINRLPAGNIEGMLRLLGIERNSGTPPTGTVTIIFKDDGGYTIPAGTRCGYLDTTLDEPLFYVFEITATGNSDDVVVTQGTTTATAVITGVNFEKYPALPAGTSLQMLSAVSSVNSITLVDAIERGADSESDSEYFTRAMTKFASLSETLVTPDQFTAYVLSTYSSVYRATTISRLKYEKAVTAITRNASNVVTAYLGASHGASAGDVIRVLGSTNSTLEGVYTVSTVSGASVTYASTGASVSAASATMLSSKFQVASSGLPVAVYSSSVSGASLSLPQNGYVAVYVSGLSGASLTATQLATIESDLTSKALAGLTVRVFNAQVVPVSIAVTVTLKYGYTSAAVTASINDALNQYLHPNYWDWSSTLTIYKNELIALVDRVAGVDRVVDLTITETSSLATISGNDFVFTYLGLLPQHTTTVTVATS